MKKEHEVKRKIREQISKCETSKNNAFININRNCESELDESLSSKKLYGVTIGIKDNIWVKGMKCTCASKMLENFIPEEDATVVKKLKDNGAVIIGKTNMDEFAMGSSTTTGYFGPAINPLSKNEPLICGGSSGGSAVAVAGGECDIALGSDTGGSVRHPAALCNVTAIKPTYGRHSRRGLIPLSESFDTIGVISKDIKRIAICTDIISGYDYKDNTSAHRTYISLEESCTVSNICNKKVGIISNYYDSASNENKESMNKAIKILKNAGYEVKEFSFPEIGLSLHAYYILVPVEAASNLSRYDGTKSFAYSGSEKSSLEEIYKSTRSEGFGSEVKRRIAVGNYILCSGGHIYYEKAIKFSNLIKKKFKKIFSEVDIIVTPVVTGKAFSINSKLDPISMRLQDEYTVPINIAGLPAISIPMSDDIDKFLPVQIIAGHFNEHELMIAGTIIEGGR